MDGDTPLGQAAQQMAADTLRSERDWLEKALHEQITSGDEEAMNLRNRAGIKPDGRTLEEHMLDVIKERDTLRAECDKFRKELDFERGKLGTLRSALDDWQKGIDSLLHPSKP